jgi:GT2 family glycosyltransferase
MATTLNPTIGIGITTRDRWDDLALTLEEIFRFGFNVSEIIVIDDGSARPAPPELIEAYPQVSFKRYEGSKGLVVRRNELARTLKADLYLSLDDDSFPVAGDVDEAGRWLTSREDAIAVGFPVILAGEALPQGQRDSGAVPEPVRSYIGCAHLVKRVPFLELGGYTEELYYFCEEPDFALRAEYAGLKVYLYPKVIIRHQYSFTNRNHDRLHRFYCRNSLLLGYWHYPLPAFLRQLVTLVPSLLTHASHRPYWKAILLGYFEGLGKTFHCQGIRRPLSWKSYRTWSGRPKLEQGVDYLLKLGASEANASLS